jgi:NAD(P)H-hydrate epimerase
MRILTSDEVLQAASGAIRKPDMSALTLMQRAGYAVAQFCVSNFKFKSVCVICGQGNNGAHGLAAAGALRGIATEIFVIILAESMDELGPDAAAICAAFDLQPVWVADESDFETQAIQEALNADLVLDAIVGAGFKPPLRGLAQRAVAAINDASGTIISLDLPSGVDADSRIPVHENADDIVFAHGIITFIAPRSAHILGELSSGPIAVSEIGIQPALVPSKTNLNVITGQEVGITFPPRCNEAHKSDFGHVLVVAGALGQEGAAGLVGIAALTTGAGLVTVACPKSIQATVAGFSPVLMTEGMPETDEGTISTEAGAKLNALLTGKDVVVLGPGLSRHPQTAEFIRQLVARCRSPLVLDADGLNAFEGHYNELKRSAETLAVRVLALHPGEAARLLGVSTNDIQADKLEAARCISRETGSCVVLKGWRTVVSGVSGETWINMSGNPAMAKSGSGSVLSGMIGAALGRHAGNRQQNIDEPSPLLMDISVAAAVYLHGLAGDIARDALHENTVLATDLLEELAEAFRDCGLQMDQGLFYLHK